MINIIQDVRNLIISIISAVIVSLNYNCYFFIISNPLFFAFQFLFWCHLFNFSNHVFLSQFFLGKDGSKVTTVVATPGQGPDRPQEVSYSDTKVIGNGSFGVVFQAKLCDTGELVAIKKVLQDKRFKVSWRDYISI